MERTFEEKSPKLTGSMNRVSTSNKNLERLVYSKGSSEPGAERHLRLGVEAENVEQNVSACTPESVKHRVHMQREGKCVYSAILKFMSMLGLKK